MDQFFQQVQRLLPQQAKHCLYDTTNFYTYLLERLMRYTARGSVSLERLGKDDNGELISTFGRQWSEGSTGITLSPLALLEQLAALVPPPRVPPGRVSDQP